MVPVQDGTQEIARVLVPQMGSDDTFISKGLIDQRKYAYLEDAGEVLAISHFRYRAKHDNVRYFDHLCDDYLNLTPSIQGLNRRQTIDLTAASTGSKAPELIKKPGLLARNIWKRGWRDKAEREGKVVVE